MKWLSLSAARYATDRAAFGSTGYATRDATFDATFNAVADATLIPDHPTDDHITALLERAKENAR